MKKSNFLSLILICVIVASLIIFTKAICEDEDSALDILCNTNDSFRYEELFASILSYSGIFYEYHDIAISPKSIMAYLERHEKSPPVNPVIFVTA
jgi:hypothetical protein